MCTSVCVTLNGAETLTLGAVVSVEPVTAILPVAPVNDHSGVTPPAGAAVGQVLSAVAGRVGLCVTASEVTGVVGAGVVLSELHAASVMTADAAQATSATEEYPRKEFTGATLPPHDATPAVSPQFAQSAHDKDPAAATYINAEDNVKNRLRNLLLGAAVLIAGVVGLFLPVSAWNGGSSTVRCGNAIVAEKPAPSTTNLGRISVAVPEQAAHPDYAAQCDSAISSRRHWAIPLVIVGTAGVLLGIFYRPRRTTA